MLYKKRTTESNTLALTVCDCVRVCAKVRI